VYCPACLTEYREGFNECADCQVPLNAGLPPSERTPQETFPQLVGVLDTNDSFALGMATAALAEANIIYDIVSMAAVSEYPGAAKSKWWIPPCRVMVSVEDETDARALVEPFQQPIPGFDAPTDPT
jgi:hypothetical protein